MNAVIDIFASAGLWAAVLRIATPLILGTLGALLCERSGVLNLGIEGIMTFGAMIGWLAVYNGADLWTGLLVAALSGGVFGLLHAALTVTLGLSQHVSGLGVTLFASSFSYYVFRLLVPVAGTPPAIEPFQPIAMPALSSSPSSVRRSLRRRPRPTRRSCWRWCSATCSSAHRSGLPSV